MSAHLGQLRGVVGWILPSAMLVLMPKCPACVAAYVALGTGIGLSFSTAWYLRVSVLALCIAWIGYLAVQSIRRRFSCCCGTGLR